MGFPSRYGSSGRTSQFSHHAHNYETGKRVKKVFDGAMTAHVWATQTQDCGQSNNGNFYFQDRAIWSYGSHFCVAYILPGNVVLYNSDTHSISTSGHQSDARGATRHMQSVHVPKLQQITGPLDRLLSGEKLPKDIKAARRAAIVTHVTAHALALEDEAGAFLLRFAGVKEAAGRFARIKLAAARKQEKEKAEEAKAETNERLKTAKRIAEMTPQEFTEYVHRQCTDGDRHIVHTAIPRALETFRRAHKAASKAGRVVVKKKVWARIKELELVLAEAAKRYARKEANAYLRQSITGLRGMIEKYQANTDAANLWEVSRFIELAKTIAQAKALLPETRAALLALVEQARARAEVLRAEAAVRAEVARAEEQARKVAARAAWLEGTSSVRPYGLTDEHGGALLRAVGIERDDAGVITGGMLQTSQGADVPLTHAIKAFRFIKLVRERGTSWHRNGQSVRVGHFQVDAIEPNGNFKAGCHRINWGEVERVALALGVLDLGASTDAVEVSHAQGVS